MLHVSDQPDQEQTLIYEQSVHHTCNNICKSGLHKLQVLLV